MASSRNGRPVAGTEPPLERISARGRGQGSRTPAVRLATLGGKVLAGIFSTASRVRPTLKPLHPRGALVRGRIEPHGMASRTGVAWLDQPGQGDVLVRTSRAAGLPPRLPDVEGLAIRVALDDGFADLLFATTGTGRPSRFLLRPGRKSSSVPTRRCCPIGPRPARCCWRFFRAPAAGTSWRAHRLGAPGGSSGP